MKMKPTVKILVCVLAAGSAWAQNPSIIQNTRNSMNAVSNSTTAASNEALGIQQSPKSPAPVTAKQASNPTKPSVVVVKAPAKTVAVKAPAKIAAVNGPAKTSAVTVPVKSSAVTEPAKKPAVSVKSKAAAKAVPVVSVRPAPKPKAAAKEKAPAKKAEAAVAAPAGKSEDKSEKAETDQSPPLDSKYAANGRRDPFISPVVSHGGSTACSSGKKCLEIGTINLKGVVHSEGGFIAVVSNGLNKAYFLRENDPVFNGYVVKITGDSIVFQETLQDRLGKSFTREVVKKITTPAV
jgi:Tfp pilus assembly protein PilP